jgi:hypothetical protein
MVPPVKKLLIEDLVVQKQTVKKKSRKVQKYKIASIFESS